MISIKPLLPSQWQLHKTMRCASLADAPHAYSSTLENALKRSDEDWIRLTNRYTSNPNGIDYFDYINHIPCGMAACLIDGDQAEMFAVWVDPAYRRAGVGRALIEYARTWAESQGAAQLNVGVYDDNPAALELYRSVGFEDIGLTKPEISTGNRTVLLLTKVLISSTHGKSETVSAP